jgi:hypothetical protein
MKPLETLRAVYGAAELLLPGTVERLLVGTTPDARARKAIRILGARHLLQAAVTARGGRTVHHFGGGVDTLHALTMVGLAAFDPERRRAATVNAAIALAFAAGEFR